MRKSLIHKKKVEQLKKENKCVRCKKKLPKDYKHFSCEDCLKKTRGKQRFIQFKSICPECKNLGKIHYKIRSEKCNRNNLL